MDCNTSTRDGGKLNHIGSRIQCSPLCFPPALTSTIGFGVQKSGSAAFLNNATWWFICQVAVCVEQDLNAELGRLCPFSAPSPKGAHNSTCLPRFPPRVFHGQIFTPDKHKVSAPNASIQKWSKLFAPEKIEETWKKLTFNILLLHCSMLIVN